MTLVSAVDLSAVSTALAHPLAVAASGSLGLPALGAVVAALLVLRASLRIARVLASTAVALGLLAVLLGVVGASSAPSGSVGASASPAVATRPNLELRRSERTPLASVAPRREPSTVLYGVVLGAVPAALGVGLLAVIRRRQARGPG